MIGVPRTGSTNFLRLFDESGYFSTFNEPFAEPNFSQFAKKKPVLVKDMMFSAGEYLLENEIALRLHDSKFQSPFNEWHGNAAENLEIIPTKAADPKADGGNSSNPFSWLGANDPKSADIGNKILDMVRERWMRLPNYSEEPVLGRNIFAN